MNQIGIKLPIEEIKFLDWYSKKTANSKAGIYRDATLTAFQKWKLEILLKEYEEGKIGFKEMCSLGNLTLLEGMKIVETEQIEPPITDLMDEYTETLTLKNIKHSSGHHTKSKKPLKRTSPEIKFEDENS